MVIRVKRFWARFALIGAAASFAAGLWLVVAAFSWYQKYIYIRELDAAYLALAGIVMAFVAAPMLGCMAFLVGKSGD